jgi:pyruvyltransferase
MIKVYWHNKERNFGDMLSPIILKGLGIDCEFADKNIDGKLLAVGSIFYAARRNDIVWGSGLIADRPFDALPGMKFLAVRGPLTRDRIFGGDVPKVYGDPAILLPEIYTPKILPKREFGFVPHYVDFDSPDLRRNKERFIIDVRQDPFKTIDEICSCKLIVSSSLHGIIVAEAYGIPAVWIKLSDKLIGGSFKFNDYFIGSGREARSPDQIGDWHVIPPPKYEKEKLIKAIKDYDFQDR